ncbi:MAG: YbaY family lipoprotein [Pseudonocardiaceae bacterium]
MSGICGTVRFEGLAEPLQVAAVHVRLLDVAVADGPDRTVSERTIRSVTVSPGKEVPFDLDDPVLEAGGQYTVFVHADVAGDGDVTVGDFLTTATHTVPARPARSPLRVTVRRVG